MRLRLQHRNATRWALAALNVLPLPGAGAMWAGYRNPHTTLLRNGALQAVLVLFGSYPWILPGAAGFVWACRDAWRIAHAELLPLPPQGDDGRAVAGRGP
jgi:hypothetical protein